MATTIQTITIGRRIIKRMGTDDRLYRLLAWLSPAFPVGGFSYSHALEAAVEEGRVATQDDLVRYVAAIIVHGSGRADATLLCATWRAVTQGDEAGFDDAVARAATLRATAEFALEGTAQGEAFLSTVHMAWPDLPLLPWLERLRQGGRPATYPVAIGLATACAGIPLRAAVLGYLHAFAGGIVGAGIKLIPLGQTDGQRALAALEAVVEAAADAAIDRDPDAYGSAAPMIELWSMRHERQYTRLFRS